MLLTISGKIGSKILQKPFKRQVMLNELDPSTETRVPIYINTTDANFWCTQFKRDQQLWATEKSTKLGIGRGCGLVIIQMSEGGCIGGRCAGLPRALCLCVCMCD